jgi:hypothetical protein
LSSGDAGDQRASRYLALWLYGHIVEASAPYEVIANLLEVACGSHYAWGTNFPPKKSGAPQSPGEKLAKIRRLADVAGLPDVTLPLQEVWNRHLRNAVFHSDYTIYDDELRLRNPTERIAWADVLSRVNRALAYHGALEAVFQWYIGEYKEPKRIPTSEHFDGHPELEWVVVVREGYGAAGVKDAWDVHDEETGRIPLRVGQFYPDEVALLNADPALAVLPARS